MPIKCLLGKGAMVRMGRAATAEVWIGAEAMARRWLGFWLGSWGCPWE